LRVVERFALFGGGTSRDADAGEVISDPVAFLFRFAFPICGVDCDEDGPGSGGAFGVCADAGAIRGDAFASRDCDGLCPGG